MHIHFEKKTDSISSDWNEIIVTIINCLTQIPLCKAYYLMKVLLREMEDPKLDPNGS